MEIVSKRESYKLKRAYKERRNLMNKCRDADLAYKVKQIVSKMIGNLVTTERIQSQISKDKTFDHPSRRKIRSILKNDIKMKYKRVDRIKQKMTSKENIVLFYQSAGIQILLDKYDWELVFIDEFTVDSSKHAFRGWKKSEVKDFIKASSEGLYFNITIAFSKNKIYGIMINKNADDSDSFIYFLKWLMIDKQLEDNDENLNGEYSW